MLARQVTLLKKPGLIGLSLVKSLTLYSLRLFGLLALLPLTAMPVLAAPTPEIVVTGGTASLRDNVRYFLPFAEEGCQTPRWRIRSLLRRAETDISRAGQALGYYHLSFDSNFETTADCWKVTIALDPGEPIRVSQVRIDILGEGAGDPVFQALRDDPGIKVGDRLNHGRYESLKSRFGSLAAERGYFSGYFDLAQVGVDLVENSARVELVYNSGPRFRFGDISIEQDILDDDFVQRYINFEEGDPYDVDTLLKLKNLYNASNYFSLARVLPDLQNLEAGQVPIVIQLDERKRHSYSVGAGLATDTGPRLILGYEDRYVTRRGHSFAATGYLAEVRSSVEAAYTIPMRRPAHQFLRIGTGFQREKTDDTLSELTRVGVSYSTYRDDGWLQTYAVNYEMEDYVVGSAEKERSHLVIPSMQFSRTSYDGSAYPLSGWRVMTRLSGSPESLGSKTSFLQLNGSAKYIYPAFGGRFLMRVDAGKTWVDQLDDLPVSVRFFAGGDASVRGYGYKAIAHRDPEGNVIGGRNLLVASVEYDYLIRPKWALAAFYDQGDAPEDYHFNFRRSVGVGVRWISPIGPVRLDLACALDDVRCGSSGTSGWGLHLSMGPDL